MPNALLGKACSKMKLLSLNIQQGGGKRIDQLLAYLSSVAFDVLLLQEFRNNHNGALIKAFLNARGFDYAFNKTSPSQNTVLTAARHLKQIPEVPTINDWSCLVTQIGTLKLFNVYFPQKHEKKPIFDYIHNEVKNQSNVIVIGDFNTGNNIKDSEGMKFKCEEEFNQLADTILLDAFRHLHPTQNVYSWYSNKGNGFRIDHALVSTDLKNNITSAQYDQSSRKTMTDHASLIVELNSQTPDAQLIQKLQFCDDSESFDSLFMKLVSIIPPFDWTEWDKGLSYLNKPSSEQLSSFNLDELYQLLLMITRIDRFNHGFYSGQKHSGNIFSIINAIHYNLTP